MNLLKASAFAGVIGAALASGAHADTPPPDEGADQLVLPKGKVAIDVFLEANLSKDAAFKPFSISPDIWYGATDDLTIGLVHSGIGATGFIGGVGDSLCLTGKDNGCANFYQDVGLDARYRLTGGWTVDGALLIPSTDPFFFGLKVGISNRWRFGKVAVEVQPSLYFGFTKRDLGNKESISIPVTLAYSVAPKVDLALQSGFQTPFDHAGDVYRIPLAVGVRFAATPKLGIGLAFAFPLLITGQDGGGADVRTLTLGGSYAL